MNHNEMISASLPAILETPMIPEDFDKEDEVGGIAGPEARFLACPCIMMSKIAQQFKDKTNNDGIEIQLFLWA